MAYLMKDPVGQLQFDGEVTLVLLRHETLRHQTVHQPDMCSLFLRPESGEKKNKIFRYINYFLARGNRFYGQSIVRALSHSRRMFAAFGIVLIGIWLMNRLVPQSFMGVER